MQIIKQIQKLDSTLLHARSQGASIGFVPTMGALHEGHLSLINNSLSSNDITVASIYVNPTQFNDKNDLKKYPRNFTADFELLNSAKCDIVFTPSDKEMYPETDQRHFDFGLMGELMEGKMRLGHFNGVAQIVTKLFDAVKPQRAYFGQKDFQQLAIIRKLIHDYNYKIEIIACPIIREKDGLAMSSRNTLLKDAARTEASKIYETLLKIKKNIGSLKVTELEKLAEDRINQSTHLHLDYCRIVNTRTLAPVTKITFSEPLTACIAVFVSKIRLIDNIDLIS